MTPKEYAEIHKVAYTTVMHWLQNDKIEGAVRHETPRGHWWELPENAPRPKKLSGRPKKAVETAGDQVALFETAPSPKPARKPRLKKAGKKVITRSKKKGDQ